MRVPSHPTQIRRMLESRRKQLVAQGPLLTASLAQVNKCCGQPSCSCHHGGPRHPAHHLTYKEAGQTRTVYVPVGLVEEVRAWVAEQQRLKRLMNEISQLSLALVRSHATQRRRKKGRP
jgi:hypothetical protein